MTNPRDRNQLAGGKANSQPAKLPAIPQTRTGNAAQDAFNEAVREWIEVRSGSRNNPFERALTMRDLDNLGIRGGLFTRGVPATGGVPILQPDGSYASMSVDAFAQLIKGTKLFRDLMKGVNDPTRFDDIPKQVRDILLQSIAAEAAKRGADIQRLESKLQNDTESLAFTVTELTASMARSFAGVRQTAFAFASENRAVAGQVTQVQARLDDFDSGGATVEEVMLAIADRATGLEAQWTIKTNAGGAYAAIGLAATSSIAGVNDSAIIFVANRMAFVTPSAVIGTGVGEIDPLNPDTSLIPFGVDASGVYIHGEVRINAAGVTLNDLAAATGVIVSYSSEFWKVDSSGAAVNSTITLTASLTGGLTGFVTWSKSGAGTAPPTAGTTNSWTVNAADQTDDTNSYTATLVSGGVTYTDTVTLVRVRDGSSALTGVLTNENVSITTLADGSGANYAGASGTFLVLRGSTLLASPAVSFSYVSSTGFSSAPSSSINSTTGAYAISANMNADVATVTYRATVGSTTIDKVFVLSRNKQGITGSSGANAKLLAISATSQVFQYAKSGVVTPTGITFTAVAQNLAGSPIFSVISGTATLGTSGITATLSQANMTTDAVTVQVAQDGLTDTITVVKVREGTDGIGGYAVFLTNEAHVVPADSSGNVTSFAGAGGTFKVFLGITDITTGATPPVVYSVVAGSPLTATIDPATGVYAITAWSGSADTATVTFRATRGADAGDKVFTLTKSKAGAPGTSGANAQILSLTSTGFAFVFPDVNSNTSASPAITFNALLQNVVGFATFTATAFNSGGISLGTITLGGSGNTRSMTAAQFLSAGTTTRYVQVVATLGSLTDSTTVYRGDGGSDALTAVLTNEATTVPANSSGVVSSLAGASTNINVFQGITDVTSLWNFTKSDSGMTSTLTGNGTANVTISATAVSSDTATVTITATRGGFFPTLTKIFTVTKSKAGAAGTAGTNGSDGARGSLQGYGSNFGIVSSSWNDGQAQAVIYNMLNGTSITSLFSTTHLRIGDFVTLSNGSNFAATKYWDGTQWALPGVTIDGNLLASGSVSALAVNAVTTVTVAGNAITVPAQGTNTTPQTMSVANIGYGGASASIATGSVPPTAAIINAVAAFTPAAGSPSGFEEVDVFIIRNGGGAVVQARVSLYGNISQLVPLQFVDSGLTANSTYTYGINAVRLGTPNNNSPVYAGSSIAVLGSKR